MRSSTQRNSFSTRDLTAFALLGAIMFLSKIITQPIPANVHFLGLFIAAITLAYRGRALIPLYVYVLLEGVYWGFAMWWVPYLYVFLPLWLLFMLAGKLRVPEKARILLYMALCALHGLSFGVLYAPAHALMFGLSFEGMVAWIAAGFFLADIPHAVSNFAMGALIAPLSSLLVRLKRGGGN